MLTIGNKFPEFKLTGVVSSEQKSAFKEINSSTYKGKWLVVFAWPKDFTVDPANSQTVYVGASDAHGQEQAGLWRTTDGGSTWTRLLRKGSEHFGAYLHPKHPGWIYATLTEGPADAGLWLSQDNGASWKSMSLPFGNAQRVSFDPADDSVIYVSTFGGGVWRGPASE